MKTRHLTLAALTALALAACSPAPTSTTSVEARLRNDLPATCTAEQQKACPAVNVASCPDGQEPVLDYSSDCCAHFTCQPVCQSAQAKTCPMTPAPVCPGGTKLWIGTAVEDCCPAYRCEPDGSACDPATGTCACDATSVACTLALPYCGPNVQPVVVGQTADCCPVYQCPCVDATGVKQTDPSLCGCTFPNCKAGEEVVCKGADSCGGPCYCQPAQGSCTTDAQCSSDARCDLSNCLLPPTAVPASTGAACDPSACGPALGQPNKICPDGVNTSGPTGKCLSNPDGTCGWEIAQCPPVPGTCYGNCVPNVQSGCKADSDCPSGQACSITCSGWGCATGGTTTTGGTGTGSTPPPSSGGSSSGSGGSSSGSACACPASDPSCSCDANGNCSGKTCAGQCAPVPSKCDSSKPVACPAIAIACPNGATPVQSGVDPTSCCPTYQCPTCAKATTANVACPAIAICACAKQTGTDPTTCCPTYDCGPVKADGTCG